MASNGWANLGSAVAGNGARQAQLYEQGATGAARLEGLLADARMKRDQAAQLGNITPEAIEAANRGDPGAQATLLSYFVRGDRDPRQLSGYNRENLGTTIQQDAYDRVKAGAPIADVNPLLAVFQGKPVDLSNVKDGVVYNPMVTPDQSQLSATPVGMAEIMQRGAEADAAKARASSSYANAAKTRSEIGGLPGAQPGTTPPPPRKPPVGYRYKADGSQELEPIPGGPADKGQNAGRPPNNEQSNAAGFAARMVAAAKEIDALESGGYSPVNGRDRAGAGIGGPVGNFLMTDNGQKYNQAAMNFVRANLRKESGAAIGKDEATKEYENYFPVAGDSEGVIQQKAANRATLIQNMIQTAGPAWHARGNAAEPAPAAQAPAASGIQPGHEEGGYRFKGGDAGNPDNWEKL